MPKRTDMGEWCLRIICLFFLLSCSSLKKAEHPARTPANASNVIDISKVQNTLRAFESDGCSSFSRGIPFPKEEKWGLCCVQHDISYWKGGTSEDRYQADQRLQNCIIGIGEPNVARLVYWTVRGNTHDSAATQLPWGYGWHLSRGYAPFSDNEKKQITTEESKIPEDLAQIPIVATKKILRTNDSLTGNTCLDSSIEFIQKNLSRQMSPLTANEFITEVPGGFEYNVSIMTKECFKPYVFTYWLRKKDACSKKPNEPQLKFDVKLKDIDYPQECQ